jgi:hypothetical protein
MRVTEQVEREKKYAAAMNSKFHLEKTDYEPTKPATLSPVGI